MARLIGQGKWYREFSATSNTVQDIRNAAEQAEHHLKLNGAKGVLFLDEIHRFTKAQQDIFLTGVEKGLYTCIRFD